MIACLDVYYSTSRARAAAVVLKQWTSEVPIASYSADVSHFNGYEPGHFYRRELKPLLSVISQIREEVLCYVIDGYCHLSPDREPGLGARLAEVLPSEKTVVGVAKNRFRNSRHAFEVLRGSSKRPLFVTAVGLDYKAAANFMQSMKGDHRIPTILKNVDHLSRQTYSQRALGESHMNATRSIQ